MTSATTSETNPEYTIVVALRHMKEGTQFLLVRHRERGWELPGGKLEGKEGPVHCALREFREETGHLLAIPRFVMKMDKANGKCYVFQGGLGEAVTGTTSDDAIVEFGWFDALPEENLAFPDDPYEEMGEAIGIQFRPN